MDAICSVTREKEEKLLLLVQVMVISMITMMMVIYSLLIMLQENLDWGRLAGRAAWLTSKSETTVASLLSMAGQVMIILLR